MPDQDLPLPFFLQDFTLLSVFIEITWENTVRAVSPVLAPALCVIFVIAEKIGVTEGTVKAHLHSIYEELGVRSRIELMIALVDRSKLAPD